MDQCLSDTWTLVSFMSIVAAIRGIQPLTQTDDVLKELLSRVLALLTDLTHLSRHRLSCVWCLTNHSTKVQNQH